MERQRLVDFDAIRAASERLECVAERIHLESCADAIRGMKAAEGPEAVIRAALDGNSVHFVTGGRWSMYELLAKCLVFLGPSKLTLSTFSITETSARMLATHLHEGRLRELNMLIDYRAKVRYPEVYQLASNVATRIRLTPVHAKVMVLQGDGLQLTMAGSANWTENKRIEQGVMTANPAAATYYLEWLNKAIDNGNPFE